MLYATHVPSMSHDQPLPGDCDRSKDSEFDILQRFTELSILWILLDKLVFGRKYLIGRAPFESASMALTAGKLLAIIGDEVSVSPSVTASQRHWIGFCHFLFICNYINVKWWLSAIFKGANFHCFLTLHTCSLNICWTNNFFSSKIIKRGWHSVQIQLHKSIVLTFYHMIFGIALFSYSYSVMNLCGLK